MASTAQVARAYPLLGLPQEAEQMGAEAAAEGVP